MEVTGAFHPLQLLLDVRNSLADQSTIGLDLGFSRSAKESKTAALAFEMGPGADQTATLVGQMRELDLQRSFASAGAPPKDFENEPGPIQHLGFPGALQVALLHGRERTVHHHQSGFGPAHQAREFIDLALADIGRRIDCA
jgi:hypothetical protein